MSVPHNSQNVFATEEIPELLPTGGVLGRDMGITSIALVTSVLVTGSRPGWCLLACPQEDDRMLEISPCTVAIIPSLNKVADYFNNVFVNTNYFVKHLIAFYRRYVCLPNNF